MNNSHVQFIDTLPNRINYSDTSKYTINDWEKHFRIILRYSLGTIHQEYYYNSYLAILKHKLNSSYEIIIKRYIVFDTSTAILKQ